MSLLQSAVIAPVFNEHIGKSSFCPLGQSQVACSLSDKLAFRCKLKVHQIQNANQRTCRASKFAVKAIASEDAGRKFTEVEILDPSTGIYRVVSGEYNQRPERVKNVERENDDRRGDVDEDLLDESSDGESEEELLRRFAEAAGIEDSDIVAKMSQKMRNATTARIVSQLEEGAPSVEDLLKDMFVGLDKCKQLFTKVDKLLDNGENDAARDLVEENYELLLEQMEEGNVGVEQAAMLDLLAYFHLRLGEKETSEELLQQATLVLKQVPDDEPLKASILEQMGSMYIKLNKSRQALPFLERSLDLRKKSQENDVSSLMRTTMGLAAAYSDLDMTSQSIEMYKQILAYAEDILGSDDEDLAAPLMHLGSTLLEDGRLEEAEMTIQRARNLTAKVVGTTDGKYGVATCVLAQVKSAEGEFDEAVDLFKRGIEVIESCPDFQEGDENISTVQLELAALLDVLGKSDESKKVLLKVNMSDKKMIQFFAAQQVEFLEKLAERYVKMGNFQQAEAVLRRCLHILKENVGPDAIQVSVVLELLAQLLQAQPDRLEEVLPLARESLRIREKLYGKYHASVGDTCGFLASVLHDIGQDNEAIDLMYRVLDIQEREYGPDDPGLEQTLEVLNMLITDTNRYSESADIDRKLERLRRFRQYSAFSV